MLAYQTPKIDNLQCSLKTSSWAMNIDEVCYTNTGTRHLQYYKSLVWGILKLIPPFWEDFFFFIIIIKYVNLCKPRAN